MSDVDVQVMVTDKPIPTRIANVLGRNGEAEAYVVVMQVGNARPFMTVIGGNVSESKARALQGAIDAGIQVLAQWMGETDDEKAE